MIALTNVNGKETIFEDYVVQSNADNVINLEVPIDNFYKALRSAANASDSTVRLSKKNNQPLLSLSTTWSGRAFGSNIVTHNIPVRVLSQSYVSVIKEPTAPEPDCHIFLPQLNFLRHVVDKYKSLSDRIIMSANMSGELQLSVNIPSARVSTKWKGLENPELDPSQVEDISRHPSQTRAPEEFVHMRLDSKDLVNMLKISSVAKRVIACMYYERILFMTTN